MCAPQILEVHRSIARLLLLPSAGNHDAEPILEVTSHSSTCEKTDEKGTPLTPLPGILFAPRI
jgi:hypothetical protein